MLFRDQLRAEFERRKSTNARYSIRAFAAALGADHSSLAQILRGVRTPPPGRIRAWAKKLGMSPEEAAVYVAASHASTVESSRRAHQLLNWTSEALAVIHEPAHFELLRLLRDPQFQPDVRWIAARSGCDADQVNTALSRLLRLGLIEMTPNGWQDRTGIASLTEAAVRGLALERVRQAVAEQGIRIDKENSA